MAELAKTHILFPVPLLRQIDRLAGVGRRSAFVIEAAHEKLGRLRFREVLQATAGSWKGGRRRRLETQRGLNRLLKTLRSRTSKRLSAKLHG